jgi:polysaccharide export outer membrane protein
MRSFVMIYACMKKSLVALLVFVTTMACSTVAQTPPVANHSRAPAAASNSSTSSADINRSIAAVATLHGSASSSDYQIGSEDLLEITVFNIPEAALTERHLTPRTQTVRVSHRGQISLPLVGEIAVMGLTVSGLEEKLRDHYDRYIHNPQISVLVKEFRQRVSIIGAVQKPGVFELTGPKTVIEVLAMAGGVTEKAASQVHIYRQGPKGRETHVIDLTVLANSIGLINENNAGMVNMPVQPGDMINIPEAGMFFVDGAVRKPGSYPLGRRYSLTQALATAGGVDPELNSDMISVFRRQGPGEVQTIALDLSDVLSGNIADPQIQPDDVIVVPTSTAKYLVKRFVGQLLGGISIGGLPGLFGS